LFQQPEVARADRNHSNDIGPLPEDHRRPVLEPAASEDEEKLLPRDRVSADVALH